MFDTEIYNAKIVKTSLYKYVTDYKANVPFGQYFRSCKTCKSWSRIRRITYVEKRMEKFDVRFFIY